MDPKATIIESLELARGVLKGYLEGLSDDEFFMRPAENANHIAWQMGHILGAEYRFISLVAQHPQPELPEGFLDKHSTETSTSDTREDFFSHATYMSLIDPIRDATIQELKDIAPERLSEKTPTDGPEFVQTIGSLFQLCASHAFLHMGQIVVLRRRLGKPIVLPGA